MAEAMVQKIIRIPPELNDKLEIVARQTGRTQTDIVAEAIREAVTRFITQEEEAK